MAATQTLSDTTKSTQSYFCKLPKMLEAQAYANEKEYLIFLLKKHKVYFSHLANSKGKEPIREYADIVIFEFVEMVKPKRLSVKMICEMLSINESRYKTAIYNVKFIQNYKSTK